MPDRTQARDLPSLRALFTCFQVIGMQSFGGGLSSWMRREIVQRREWLDDRPFLSGLALSQIAPGANAVNLAVFIGTTLRGVAGAIASLAGLMLLPTALVLVLGALYARHHALPGLEAVLGGVGAAAIGLNLATGWRMMRRNIRGVSQFGVMLVTTVSIGVFNLQLLPVLLVMLPVSVLLHRRRGAR